MHSCSSGKPTDQGLRGDIWPQIQIYRHLGKTFFFLMTKRQINHMIDQEIKSNRKHPKVFSGPLSNTTNLYL